jgi:uncharacterized protein (DUF2147 family)
MKTRFWIPVCFCFLSVFASTDLRAQGTSAADAILGVYENPEGERRMEIYKQNGQYFGKITWIRSQDGKARVGDVVLKNLTYASGQWKGKIHMPARNSDFPAVVALPDTNTLQITGKSGFASRSKEWKRVSSGNTEQ